jgi:hypothetical protein
MVNAPTGVITMMFFWKLVSADIMEARRVVEKLRQQAIDLNWLPVGDVVHLSDQECADGDRLPGTFLMIAAGETVLSPHEVVFFEATPTGDELRPFGLAAYADYMESSSEVIPTNLAGWQWVGVIRSEARQTIRSFIDTAAALGLEVTASFGGKVLTVKQDETGQIRYEERPAFPV